MGRAPPRVWVRAPVFNQSIYIYIYIYIYIIHIHITREAIFNATATGDKVIKNFAGGLTLGSGGGRVVFRTIAHTRAVGAGPWAFVSLALPRKGTGRARPQ